MCQKAAGLIAAFRTLHRLIPDGNWHSEWTLDDETDDAHVPRGLLTRVPLPVGTIPARVRVIDLETGGPGFDDVCEIGWQDVCQGADCVWRLDDERGALLVNPGRAMSPDTLAIHHILDLQLWLAEPPAARSRRNPRLQRSSRRRGSRVHPTTTENSTQGTNGGQTCQSSRT